MEVDKQAALTQLLPLFSEKAATDAMIKHSMDVNRQATQFLNPGQVPALAMDAPLYALAKYIQWKWSQNHGEDQAREFKVQDSVPKLKRWASADHVLSPGLFCIFSVRFTS